MEFWQCAPPFIGIVGTHWEPLYRWNAVYGTVEAGPKGIKHRALLRWTLGGAFWTFRATTVGWVYPKACTTGRGEDKHVSLRLLKEHGLATCALDLADHIGEREPVWQHDDWKRAVPIGPTLAQWGITR